VQDSAPRLLSYGTVKGIPTALTAAAGFCTTHTNRRAALATFVSGTFHQLEKLIAKEDATNFTLEVEFLVADHTLGGVDLFFAFE
jgi:hypothetical protein